MWLEKGGGVLRPKGLGVVQGGFDYAIMKAKVESTKDKGVFLSHNKEKCKKKNNYTNRWGHNHIKIM